MLAACGESSSDSDEPSGTYDVKVTEASLPALQRLGQTTLLKLAIRNTGEETVPNLLVTFGVAGKQGAGSPLPFGVRDPQPELAQPERPVWVLSEHYPRLAGAARKAGAATSNKRTFAFGRLEPGQSTRAEWQLNAVRAGKWTLRYDVDADLSSKAKARTEGGVAPGGSFRVAITPRLQEVEVTDSGEVVQIGKSGK